MSLYSLQCLKLSYDNELYVNKNSILDKIANNNPKAAWDIGLLLLCVGQRSDNSYSKTAPQSVELSKLQDLAPPHMPPINPSFGC